MTEWAIEIKDLHKRFGSQQALAGLSMHVPLGSVTGLIGANGAGKTTTYSIIGGFLFPDQGSVQILGIPLRDFRRKGGIIGLSPQDAQFFEDRAVRTQLLLFARLSGFSGGAAKREVARVLELTNLSDRAADRVEVLSHGMRVRLGIAQALIASPPLVLLDEPTAGLDPHMVHEFRMLVDNLRGSTTLLVSSHDLGVLESVCDYVCMIHKGRLAREGSLADIVDSQNWISIRAVLTDDLIVALQGALSLERVNSLGDSVFELSFDPKRVNRQECVARLLKFCLEKQVDLQGLETRQSLSQRYLDTTTGVADR